MRSSKPCRSVLLFVVAIALTCCAAPTPVPTDTPGPVAPVATATPEPVTITFWEWWGGATGDFFDEEAKRFHERYPWITLEISHYTDQRAYRETLGLAFESPI